MNWNEMGWNEMKWIEMKWKGHENDMKSQKNKVKLKWNENEK